MSIESELRHSGQTALKRLVALRDEAKLQFHLLSLDAQQAFTKLESQVAALETNAKQQGDLAVDSLKTAANDLTRAFNDLIAIPVPKSSGLLTSVRTLMTSHVRTCRPEDTLNEVAHLMWQDDCGAIPVAVDGRIVGIVTDRDVCMAAYTQGRSPAELRVDVAMSKQLFSCNVDESVGDALAMMASKRVRRLPVLSSGGRAEGMLSLADVARWAVTLGSSAVDAALTETLAAVSARVSYKLTAAEESKRMQTSERNVVEVAS